MKKSISNSASNKRSSDQISKVSSFSDMRNNSITEEHKAKTEKSLSNKTINNDNLKNKPSQSLRKVSQDTSKTQNEVNMERKFSALNPFIQNQQRSRSFSKVPGREHKKKECKKKTKGSNSHKSKHSCPSKHSKISKHSRKSKHSGQSKHSDSSNHHHHRKHHKHHKHHKNQNEDESSNSQSQALSTPSNGIEKPQLQVYKAFTPKIALRRNNLH